MKVEINRKDIYNAMILFIAISLAFGVMEGIDYTHSLKTELENRDQLIESLNKRDSLLRQSLSYVDSIKYGHSNINISELVKYANSKTDEVSELHKRINVLNDSVNYYKIYFNFSQSKYNHKYTVSNNGRGKTYSLDFNAVKRDECNKYINKYNEKVAEINKLSKELYSCKRALSWYGISSNENNSSKKNPFFSPFNAPKLDSALILLEGYRDKLKYDKVKNTWKIGNRVTMTMNTVTDTIKDCNPKPVR